MLASPPPIACKHWLAVRVSRRIGAHHRWTTLSGSMSIRFQSTVTDGTARARYSASLELDPGGWPG
jgi:hypothetical protein